MPRLRCPVIDSHVHLYAASHLSSLNWTHSLPEDHILNQQRTLTNYREHVQNSPEIVGIILVEADRIFSHDPQGWEGPLDEVEFLVRVARGQPVVEEGHTSSDKQIIRGIIPWAPVAAGPAALQSYISQMKRICATDETGSLIRGFRYLVQDKPKGTMTTKDFVSALQMLGHNQFVFDLAVDARSGGLWQLTEACDMLQEVYSDGNSINIIINHFCKPNLRLAASEANANSHEYAQWSDSIRTLAGFPRTFMKLSGFFSELPAQREESPEPIQELAKRLKPWTDVVFEAFGPSRIMFGSDWPVCTANGLGSDSWQHWHDLVTHILDDRGLTEEEKEMIWSGTAIRAYIIKM